MNTPKLGRTRQAKARMAATSMNPHVDISAEQYYASICTSYTGGASWLSRIYPNGHVVIACTPVEIAQFFQRHAGNTIRGLFVESVES